MTNYTTPHPNDDPEKWAKELADQHFSEAIDNLFETANEMIRDTFDLDESLGVDWGEMPQEKRWELIDAYRDRLTTLTARIPDDIYAD